MHTEHKRPLNCLLDLNILDQDDKHRKYLLEKRRSFPQKSLGDFMPKFIEAGLEACGVS